MGDSNAVRQRRYRLHRKGDHSECDPSRCNGDAPVTGDVTPRRPRFDTRGRRLWQDMRGDGMEPARRLLLEEACRLADRLERLDELLRGDRDAWVRLHTANEDGSIVKVVLNNALAEARQQQATLKQIVAELRQSAGKSDQPSEGGSILDQLAARRAARRTNTAG